MTNIRVLAAKTLTPILNHQGSLRTHLTSALEQCPEKDKALLQNICYGVMRYHPQLSLTVKHLLKKPFSHKDKDLHALMLIGIFQLEHMRTPVHAAISETVDGTKTLKKNWATGLFNAALRRYHREREVIQDKLKDHVCFKYNHPEWLIEKLSHNWPDHWQSILEQNNQPAPMTLRVNQSRVSRETYLEHLSQHGLEAKACFHSTEAVNLLQPTDPTLLPGFSEGDFSVQDEAAQLSNQLLQLKDNDRLLDACAAPGGKLCHALESNSTITATAIELESSRAQRISDNLSRLNLNAEVIIADAASSEWWDGNLFNKILVDAPCSATGVIRRNPDIKFLKSGDDIAALSNLQLEITTQCWNKLAPGGRMVYATCSIFPQENERLIKRFLAQTPDATHIDIDAEWGEKRSYGRQLFPQQNGHDGFYYAVLVKGPAVKDQL